MANVLTGGGSGQPWDLLVETAYDRQVEYYLRDMPLWRQVIDKKPGQQAMPGDTVTLSLHNPFAALATTPLTETTDPDSVPAVAPTRVNVVMNEYGNAAIATLRLTTLGFTKPDAEMAQLIGFNMADSIDAIIRAVADAGTNLLFVNSGLLKTATGTGNGVLGTDIMSRAPATVAVKLLQRAKVQPKQNNRFVGIIHPDVAYDLQAETTATAWNAPHTVGTDTEAIYSGVVGDYQGARYVETTRCTIAANTATPVVNLYSTYYFGKQALVEATAIEPHIIVGPQTDKLKRFFPLGWYCLFGNSIYRPTALVTVKTASSIAAL
jgi:N4-gp56 family major capsid protein